jgi:DMSO/TMAO reductase YedYZ molybdopterin-dependent catalytic subunit
VVPHWYAVASVKWLTEIHLVDEPFAGHFQAERYVYEWERDGALVREPVTLQQVRALITEPRAGQAVDAGDLVVRGVAWSGAAPIEQVEVSLDGGAWRKARLVGEASDAGWQWWELSTMVRGGGAVTVRARATDRAGRVQPDCAEWNRLGYGNNSVQSVSVTIT